MQKNPKLTDANVELIEDDFLEDDFSEDGFLEDDLLEDMILFSKKIARKIKSVIPCKRIAMAVVGLDVPHAHIHLIPINSIADFDFNKQTEIIKKDEMEKICELIFNA